MRGRVRSVVVGCLLSTLSSSAFGQSAAFPDTPDDSKKTPGSAPPASSAEAPPAAAPAAPQAAPTDAPPDAASAARFLYDEAFRALARGERSEARRLLGRLRSDYPNEPLATQAMELSNLLDGADHEKAKAPAEDDPDDRRPTNAARAELLFFQTVHGIGLGAEACLIFECESPPPWALSLMLGAGAGLGASLYFSSDGVTPGLARSLTSGTEWGLWNGLMIGLWTKAFEDTSNDGRAVAEGLALGQLAGLGAGGLLYMALEPTAGQVSLASSGGIWTTVVVLLSVAFVEAEPSARAFPGILLVASDLGLVGGAVLASQFPMSAGRVLLVDAGGLLGLLGGVGTAIIIGGSEPDPQLTSGLGFVGTLSGLGLGWYLTRNWDDKGDKKSAFSFGVSPVPHGAVATANFSF